MRRWQGVVALAVGATIVGGGATSAHSARATANTHTRSVFAAARGEAVRLARLVGVDEQHVAPGTLDDGKELLPQAKITLEQVVAAAQTAESGKVGEVDLEHYQG